MIFLLQQGGPGMAKPFCRATRCTSYDNIWHILCYCRRAYKPTFAPALHYHGYRSFVLAIAIMPGAQDNVYSVL